MHQIIRQEEMFVDMFIFAAVSCPGYEVTPAVIDGPEKTHLELSQTEDYEGTFEGTNSHSLNASRQENLWLSAFHQVLLCRIHVVQWFTRSS